MGESAIIVVEISVDEAVAQQRAKNVTAWLLESGVVVVNDSPEPLWRPKPLWSGPMAGQVLAGPGQWEANGGVDVICNWEIHHPGGNFTPPNCPVCGSQTDERAYVDLIEQWLHEHQEPVLNCRSCHKASPIGDWVGHYALHVGELAVSFANWPLLRDDFLAELGRRMGPRPRVIYQHF